MCIQYTCLHMDFITIHSCNVLLAYAHLLICKLCLGPFRFHGWHLAMCYLVFSSFKPSYSWSHFSFDQCDNEAELINYASQAGDTSPFTNAMDVEQTYEVGPQKSGSINICFETTIESYVDVHAIVQKWNSYCFVSRPYHRLPSNLAEKFWGS